MSQQDMDRPAEPRVAWDTDGAAWDEIIAGNGEPTAVFKYRSDDGAGDELTLGQIDEMYGLESLDSGERDRVEASRRDWAAEADRLTEVVRALSSELGEAGFEHAAVTAALATVQPDLEFDYDETPLCSCLTPEGAQQVLSTHCFSLPRCAVHPEADR